MAGRNANGEGTIYRRKDGRYEGAAYFLTTSGKRKRVRVYGRTRAEVHGKLTEAKMQVQRGAAVPDRAWRLSDYLEHWLENVVRPNRRPKTYQQYESVSRLYLRPDLGAKRLTDLSVSMIQAFLNEQLSEAQRHGHSARKVHAMRAVLSAVLSRAEREELVGRNVARLVHLPSNESQEVRPWTAEEATQFLRVTRDDPLFPAFALLLLYGFRRGEVLGLCWQSVSFEDGVIRVRQQLQRIGSTLHIGPVKTHAGKRDLPLLPFAYELLTSQKSTQDTRRHATTAAGSDLVFTTADDAPIDPDGFYRTFLRLCHIGRIRPIKLHHIRHTTATLLKQLGVPARDAQIILGHSQVSVTQQIYQHDDLETRREALGRVEALLINPASGQEGRRCRQNSRQQSSFYTRQLPSSVFNRLNHGAGRGSRTPEGVKPSDLQFHAQHLGERLQSIKQVQQARTRTWLLGCVAVKIAVKFGADKSDSRATFERSAA
jgi:integrase